VRGDHVEVLRDGTVLGSVSLGTPLPTNPGKHVILVRAEGRRDRTFEVSLAEGEQHQVLVAPGEPIVQTSALPLAATTSSTKPAQARAASAKTAAESRGAGDEPIATSSTRRKIALIVGGAGVAAIATGAVFATFSIFEYGQSKDGCDAANQCR